jgi:probable HAF family extracellular repeat protein
MPTFHRYLILVHRRLIPIVFLFFLWLSDLVSNSVVRAQAAFAPLGVFNATTSAGYDISSDGSIVAGTIHQSGADSSQFFRLSDQGVVFGPFGVDPSISADGTVIVGAVSPNPAEGADAIRWTNGGVQLLGDLPGATDSMATDTSSNGSVIVGGSGPLFGNQKAFRWTESSGMVELAGVPSNTIWSFAHGISADGSVVVGRAIDSGGTNRAFRWTEHSGLVSLELPLGTTTAWAQRVSADGLAIAGTTVLAPHPGSQGPELEAFRWTANSGSLRLGICLGVAFKVLHSTSLPMAQLSWG